MGNVSQKWGGTHCNCLAAAFAAASSFALSALVFLSVGFKRGDGMGITSSYLGCFPFFLFLCSFFPSLPPFPFFSTPSSSSFSLLGRLRVCSSAFDLLRLAGGGSPRWRPLRVVGTLDRVIVGIIVQDGSAMSLRWWEMERWGTCVTWHGHSFPKCQGLPVGMFKWDGRSGSRRTAETCSWEHISANRGDRLGQQRANGRNALMKAHFYCWR